MQACEVCGSDRQVDEKPDLRRCEGCGLVIDPTPLPPPRPYTPREVARARCPGRLTCAVRYHAFTRRIRRRCTGGRLLDVGCGAGVFVAYARGIGFTARGVDPALHAVPAAARPGLAATFAELAREHDVPFDVAVCNYSLEHVGDLLPHLRAVRDRLRPGGVLVVRVPNYEYTRRYPMTGRLQRKPGEHRLFFSHATLAAVLQRAGFEAVQVRMPLCAASLITPAASVCPGLDPDTGRRRFAAAALCALAAMTLLLMPLVLWRRIRGRDAVLEAWAVKPARVR